MAYGEYGGLLPRETAFGSPEGYTEAAKAEGFKRASYLAQMDSFYAELEEATRRFDLSLAENQRQFNEQLGFQRERATVSDEQWGAEFGLKERSLDLQADQWESQDDLGWAQLDFQKEQWSDQLEQYDEAAAIRDVGLPYIYNYLDDEEGSSGVSGSNRQFWDKFKPYQVSEGLDQWLSSRAGSSPNRSSGGEILSGGGASNVPYYSRNLVTEDMIGD